MKIRDYIFCDDIRHEQNKKVSLMGVYNDRILFRVTPGKELTWPIPIRLASIVRIDLEQNDPRPDKFKFALILNGNVLVDIEGEIKLEKLQTMVNISVAGEGLPLQQGNLGFSLSMFHGDKVIFTKTIDQAISIQTEVAEM